MRLQLGSLKCIYTCVDIYIYTHTCNDLYGGGRKANVKIVAELQSVISS